MFKHPSSELLFLMIMITACVLYKGSIVLLG